MIVTVEDIVATARNVKRGHGYYMVSCPVHGGADGDRDPSLSVRVGDDGTPQLHCHACGDSVKQTQLAEALGFDAGDIWPRANRNDPDWRMPLGGGRWVDIIARYPYYDERGTLLYEVCRSACREFRQRQPDPNKHGHWIWRTKGIRRVPYRLPQLLATIAQGEPVFIAEGEKDVDALVEAGVTATCNHMGAGEWKDTHAGWLKNAKSVVIVADRDKAGADHAAKVRESLEAIGVPEISIVVAKTGKDAFDHLAAGHGVDDFEPVSATSASSDGTASPTGSEEHELRRRMIDGAVWLRSGADLPEATWGNPDVMLSVRLQPTVIAGRQGSGKTTFAHHWMLRRLGVLEGELLGLAVSANSNRVLYLASDRPDQARLAMRRLIPEANIDLLAGRLVVWQGPPPADIGKNPHLLLELVEAAGADCLVLDSMKDIALKLSDDDVGASVNRAIQTVTAAGVDVLSLHHPRKLAGADAQNRPRGLDDLYGSTWLTAGAGSVLYLHVDEDALELVQLKTPNGICATVPYAIDNLDGRVMVADRPDLLAIVGEAGEQGLTSMHAARCLYRVSDPEPKQLKAISRKLRELEDDGLVTSTASGKRGTAKVWRAS